MLQVTEVSKTGNSCYKCTIGKLARFDLLSCCAVLILTLMFGALAYVEHGMGIIAGGDFAFASMGRILECNHGDFHKQSSMSPWNN